MKDITGRDVDLVTISLLCVDSRSTQIVIPRLIPAHALVTLAACAFQLEESRVRLIWRGQAIDAKRDLKDYVSDNESQIAIHVVYRRPPESSSEGLVPAPAEPSPETGNNVPGSEVAANATSGDASDHGVAEVRVRTIQIGLDNPLRAVVRMPYETTSPALPAWLNMFTRTFSEDNNSTRLGTMPQLLSTGPVIRTLGRQQNDPSTSPAAALASLRQFIESFQREIVQSSAAPDNTESGTTSARQQNATGQPPPGVTAAAETTTPLQQRTPPQQDRTQPIRQTIEQTASERTQPEQLSTTATTEATGRGSSTDQPSSQRPSGESRTQSSVAGMLTNVILGEVERFLQQQGLETSDSMSTSDVASVIAININDGTEIGRDTSSSQMQTTPSRTVSSQAQQPSERAAADAPQVTAPPSTLLQGRAAEGVASRAELALRQVTSNTDFEPHILLRRPRTVSSMHVVETPSGVVTLQTSPSNIIDDLFRRLSAEFSRISEYINGSSRLLSNARSLGFCSFNNYRQRQQQQQQERRSTSLFSTEVSQSAVEHSSAGRTVEPSSHSAVGNSQQRSEARTTTTTTSAVPGELNLPASFTIRNDGFISDAELSNLLNWVALDEAAECAEQVTGWRCFLFSSRTAREAHRISPLTLFLRSFQQSNHAMMSLLTQLAAWQEGLADFGTLDLVDTVIMASRISTLLANLSFVLVCILFHLASRFDYASFFRFMMNHRLLLRAHRGENGAEDAPSETNEEEFQDAQESPRANQQQQQQEEPVAGGARQVAATIDVEISTETSVPQRPSDQNPNQNSSNTLPEAISQLITQSLSHNENGPNTQAISGLLDSPNAGGGDEEEEIALDEAIDQAIRFVSDLTPQILGECCSETPSGNTETVSGGNANVSAEPVSSNANDFHVDVERLQPIENQVTGTGADKIKPSMTGIPESEEVVEVESKKPADTLPNEEPVKEETNEKKPLETVLCDELPSGSKLNPTAPVVVSQSQKNENSFDEPKESSGIAGSSPPNTKSSLSGSHQQAPAAGTRVFPQDQSTTDEKGVDCHNTRGTRLLGSSQEYSTKKPRLLSTSSSENQTVLKENVSNGNGSGSGSVSSSVDANTSANASGNANSNSFIVNRSEAKKQSETNTGLQQISSDVPALIRNRFFSWTRDPQRFSRLVVPRARQPPFSNSYRSGDVHAPMRMSECQQIPSIEPMFSLRWRDAASRVNIPTEFAEPPPETSLMVPYIKMTLKDLAVQAKNHPDYCENKFSCLDRIITLFSEPSENVHK